MSSSRNGNGKRKAAPTTSSQRKAQKTGRGRRKSITSLAASSTATLDKNVDPHLSGLVESDIDPSISFVDRSRFVHAPDPVEKPEAARAFAAVVANREPQPARSPLACVDSSKIKPQVLSAIDNFVYHGLKQDECIADYIEYGRSKKTAMTPAAISKQLSEHAWEWCKEENVVAPWRALSDRAKGIMTKLGLAEENFPVVMYPDEDGDDDDSQEPYQDLGFDGYPAAKQGKVKKTSSPIGRQDPG